jgi:hypothetical protein
MHHLMMEAHYELVPGVVALRVKMKVPALALRLPAPPHPVDQMLPSWKVQLVAQVPAVEVIVVQATGLVVQPRMQPNSLFFDAESRLPANLAYDAVTRETQKQANFLVMAYL